jgi:hypothetical protein
MLAAIHTYIHTIAIAITRHIIAIHKIPGRALSILRAILCSLPATQPVARQYRTSMASWVTLQYAIAEADRALVATVNRWCDVG